MKQTYKITRRSEEKDAIGKQVWTIEATPCDDKGNPVIGPLPLGRIWQPPVPGNSLQYSPTDPAVAAASVIGSIITLEIA